jgi:hypothetical protein
MTCLSHTHRHSKTSSAIFMAELAYIDLEVKYMADLVGEGMTTLSTDQSGDLSEKALFKY